VEIKSLATGEVFRTSTDEQGAFSAPESPGREYQISASAAGFKTTTVSRVTPVFGAPEPVNLRLEVGAATETVEVTSAAPLLQTQTAARGVGGGRGGGVVAGARGGAAAMRQSQAPQMQQQQQAASAGQLAQMQLPQQTASAGQLAAVTGVSTAAPTAPVVPVLEYRILRKMPKGDLVEVAADGAVPRGATVILRLTPRADGYVRITGNSRRTIATRAVRGGQPFDTQLPKSNQPARVEFQVMFSHRPLPSNAQPAARADAVGSLDAEAQPASITIVLNFQ
jgi:hypothetical protein